MTIKHHAGLLLTNVSLFPQPQHHVDVIAFTLRRICNTQEEMWLWMTVIAGRDHNSGRHATLQGKGRKSAEES